MQEASGAQPQHSSHSEAADPNQGGVDFNELIQTELESTKNQNTQLSQELAALKNEAGKTKDTVDKIRSVFAPEDGGEVDPIDARINELNAEIDDVLGKAIEAERIGKPIPMTTRTAISNLKFQIEMLEKGKEKDKVISELQSQLKQLANPGTAVDQQAYSNIDSQLHSALETIYGPGQEYVETKAAQFHAVASQIGEEIKALKRDDPATWERIRRDQSAQKKLVNYFVKQNMPPKARQLMEEDQIRRTPMSHDELLNAFREAKQLAAQDPQNAQAQHYVTELRRELLSTLMAKNMGKSSRVRANELFGG